MVARSGGSVSSRTSACFSGSTCSSLYGERRLCNAVLGANRDVMLTHRKGGKICGFQRYSVVCLGNAEVRSIKLFTVPFSPQVQE